MYDFAAKLRRIWPLLALLASAAMLAGAHAFERFGGFAPCVLCLKQREVYWGALALAGAGLLVLKLRSRPGLERLAAAALGLAFLTSFAIAAYHVAVEQHWVAAQCEADFDLSEIAPMDWSGPLVVPACDTPAWTMFAISMAGYNAMISLGLAALSFLIAFAPARSRAHD